MSLSLRKRKTYDKFELLAFSIKFPWSKVTMCLLVPGFLMALPRMKSHNKNFMFLFDFFSRKRN